MFLSSWMLLQRCGRSFLEGRSCISSNSTRSIVVYLDYTSCFRSGSPMDISTLLTGLQTGHPDSYHYTRSMGLVFRTTGYQRHRGNWMPWDYWHCFFMKSPEEIDVLHLVLLFSGHLAVRQGSATTAVKLTTALAMAKVAGVCWAHSEPQVVGRAREV